MGTTYDYSCALLFISFNLCWMMSISRPSPWSTAACGGGRAVQAQVYSSWWRLGTCIGLNLERSRSHFWIQAITLIFVHARDRATIKIFNDAKSREAVQCSTHRTWSALWKSEVFQDKANLVLRNYTEVLLTKLQRPIKPIQNLILQTITPSNTWISAPGILGSNLVSQASVFLLFRLNSIKS